MSVSAILRMTARDVAAAAADPTNFTPTTTPVARAIVALEQWGPRVWEPACGDGAISGQFLRAGHQVVETDLVPRGVGSRLDFFAARDLLAEDIATNPPFNVAPAFIEHALSLRPRKVLMLLPIGFLQAVTDPQRSLIWGGRGLCRVWVSWRRIPFLRGGWDAGNGGGPVHKHALFVWEPGFASDPVLKSFDWEDFA